MPRNWDYDRLERAFQRKLVSHLPIEAWTNVSAFRIAWKAYLGAVRLGRWLPLAIALMRTSCLLPAVEPATPNDGLLSIVVRP